MTTPKQGEELLPCPCCSAAARVCREMSGRWSINCLKCLLATHHFGTEEGAVSAWNTRQPDAALAQKSQSLSFIEPYEGWEIIVAADGTFHHVPNKETIERFQQKAAMLDKAVRVLELAKRRFMFLAPHVEDIVNGVSVKYGAQEINDFQKRVAALPSTPPAICERDEVIEKMAKAIWLADELRDVGSWEDLKSQNDEPRGNQQPYFDMAEAALAALKSSPKRKDEAEERELQKEKDYWASVKKDEMERYSASFKKPEDDLVVLPKGVVDAVLKTYQRPNPSAENMEFRAAMAELSSLSKAQVTND